MDRSAISVITICHIYIYIYIVHYSSLFLCTFTLFHSSIYIFLCCTLFLPHFFQTTSFPYCNFFCSNLFMLHFFSCCTLFMYCTISCCTLIRCNVFVVHSFPVAFFACWNFFLLHFSHVTLF